MPNKLLIATTLLAVIAVLGWFVYLRPNTQPGTDIEPITPHKSDLIRVSAPERNALITDPVTIIGEARGYWYFEASFPIKVIDANGTVLGIAPAQAQSEWMTEEFVPFSVTIPFVKPTTPTGEIVLEKDNPSGLPEHADELRIPVHFDSGNQ